MLWPHGKMKSAEYNVAYLKNPASLDNKRNHVVSCRMLIITVVEYSPVEHNVVSEKIYLFLPWSRIRNEFLSSDEHGKLKKSYIYQLLLSQSIGQVIIPKPTEIKYITIIAIYVKLENDSLLLQIVPFLLLLHLLLR